MAGSRQSGKRQKASSSSSTVMDLLHKNLQLAEIVVEGKTSPKTKQQALNFIDKTLDVALMSLEKKEPRSSVLPEALPSLREDLREVGDDQYQDEQEQRKAKTTRTQKQQGKKKKPGLTKDERTQKQQSDKRKENVSVKRKRNRDRKIELKPIPSSNNGGHQHPKSIPNQNIAPPFQHKHPEEKEAETDPRSYLNPEKLNADDKIRKARIDTQELYDSLMTLTYDSIHSYTTQSDPLDFLLESTNINASTLSRKAESKSVFQKLNLLATALYNRNDYEKRIELAVFCTAKLQQDIDNNRSVDYLNLFYFYSAICGAGESDPHQYRPIVKVVGICLFVIGTVIVLTAVLSFTAGFITLVSQAIHGIQASFTWTSIFQHGWELYPNYGSFIALVTTYLQNRLFDHCFGRSEIQQRIDKLDSSIKLPESIIKDFNHLISLKILKDSTKKLADGDLKNHLSTLRGILAREIGAAQNKKEEEKNKERNYLIPVLFAATAFANNLTKNNKRDTETLKLLELSFHSLKGAGLAESQPKNDLKQSISYALPTVLNGTFLLLVITCIVVCLVACHFVFFANMIAGATAIGIILKEIFTFVPKTGLENEKQKNTNVLFQNSINGAITNIEKTIKDIIVNAPAWHLSTSPASPSPGKSHPLREADKNSFNYSSENSSYHLPFLRPRTKSFSDSSDQPSSSSPEPESPPSSPSSPRYT